MKTIFTILFLFTIHFGFAQEANPYDDPFDGTGEKSFAPTDPNYDWAWEASIITAPPPPPTPVPIDGGLVFLIVAGVGYGIKRLK